MQKVYVAHAKAMDYRSLLYEPIRRSGMTDRYDFVFPHESSDGVFSSKEFFRDLCDILVVEASVPAPGWGIEMGWADAYGVPIVALCRTDAKLSSSVAAMSRQVVRYSTPEEMIGGLEAALRSVQ
ncbi:MAG: hypothetical protein ABIH41_07415 [Nanoarchaeota archaeon]